MSVNFVVLSLFLFASMTRRLKTIYEFVERLKKAGEEKRKGGILCNFELNHCLTLMTGGFLPLSRLLKQSNGPPSLAYYDLVSMIVDEFVVLLLCSLRKRLPAPVIAIEVVEALKNDCGKCLGLKSTSEVARVWLRQLLVPPRVHIAQGKAIFDLFRLRGGSNDNFEIAGSRFVCYRGSSQSVVIPKDIEILGKSCFAGNLWAELELITFENESRLTRIEDSCFSNCSFKSICIPQNVEILGYSCFFESRLESITFENESRLARIEDSCFSNCLLKSILIPQNVEILGKSCFLNQDSNRSHSRTNHD
jgi:hypothetical protein